MSLVMLSTAVFFPEVNTLDKSILRYVIVPAVNRLCMEASGLMGQLPYLVSYVRRQGRVTSSEMPDYNSSAS